MLADGTAALRDMFGAADADDSGCLTFAEATAAGLGQSYLDALYPLENECWEIESLLEFELGDVGTASTVYVQFDYNLSGTESETGLNTVTPFNTLLEAFAFVRQDGTGLVRIVPGTSYETFTGGNRLDPTGTVTIDVTTSGSALIGIDEL